ncbi:Lactaldehyde dehydrogenase [Raoultella terrigena]|nr:Lactaldehyde dehydrogenase [Raoultella terrigena]
MTAPVQHPMYIDGQFVAGRGDAWIDVLNPATEALLSRIPDGSAEDAQRAIDAAERAQPGWEALPAIERAGWLRKIAVGIRERAGEIAALIVARAGRPSSWRRWRSPLPPIISTIWPSGRGATKVKSCKATVPVRISSCSNAPSA